MNPEERGRYHALRDPLLKIPTQDVDKWIDKNVKTVADAREVLKIMARAMIVLAQKETSPKRARKTG